MKIILSILFIVMGSTIAFPSSVLAGLAVTDAALIASNRQHQQRDYIEQVLQELNQQEQIGNLAESVRQGEEYLDRLGDPAKRVGGSEFDVILHVLNQAPVHETSEEIAAEVDEKSIFESETLPIYAPLAEEINAGDERIGERDGGNFKAEAAARASFERYRAARASALERRKQLMGALRGATAKLDEAKTASEVQKLTGIILSIQTQLAAVDDDLEMATREAITRMLENRNEREVAAKSSIQTERARLRHGSRKDTELYNLPTEPTLFRSSR